MPSVGLPKLAPIRARRPSSPAISDPRSGPGQTDRAATPPEVPMAAPFLLVAIAGAAVVADLVLENTDSGAITVLHHPITSDRVGVFPATAAALGLVVGLLAVGR